MKSLGFLLLLPYVLAFEFPFSVSALFSSKAALKTTPISSSSTPRIAIIGAGAGGSSAAFWISKAKERFGLDIQMDVYEAADYIGGRTTIVHPYDNKSLPGLELGASVFVKLNKILWRAADEFNLTRLNVEELDYETGIWNGREVFVSFSGSWWDTLTLLWRYGILSPKRTQTAVRTLSDRMLDVYRPDSPRWDNISSLVETFGWTKVVNSTAVDFFAGQGVSETYIFEVIQAATRVNYDQNTDAINGLSGAVSMAAEGARNIKGGNKQIFEQFLNRSGADVYLNTKVKSITESASSGWSLKSTRGTIGYKAVILATPFYSSDIIVPPSISKQIPEQPYVNLHVTILSTTAAHPNPKYFGMPAGSKVPRVILTTKERPTGSTPPEFSSISYGGRIREDEWAVKIFSDARLSNEWLDNMFQGQVKWVTRKKWDAYPKLPPTTNFPPVKLDRGFYYVNAFEPFMSTMETQTVSSRNVVDLLLREEFNSAICPPSLTSEEDSAQNLFTVPSSEDFVLGFDC